MQCMGRPVLQCVRLRSVARFCSCNGWLMLVCKVSQTCRFCSLVPMYGAAMALQGRVAEQRRHRVLSVPDLPLVLRCPYLRC